MKPPNVCCNNCDFLGLTEKRKISRHHCPIAKFQRVFLIQIPLRFLQPGYFSQLKTFALEKYGQKLDPQHESQWVYLDFCPLGFIGKLFVADELTDFISYLSLFYNDWPCDWLLATYIRTRACPLGSSFDDCVAKCRLYAISYPRPLFQHMGTKSSLKGKISKLKVKNFKQKPHK